MDFAELDETHDLQHCGGGSNIDGCPYEGVWSVRYFP